MTSTPLRRLARASAMLLVGFALLSGTVLTFQTQADAGIQKSMTVSIQQKAHTKFDAIPASAAVSAVRAPDPDECALAEYCDTIPLRVEYPKDIDPGSEVVITITMKWDEARRQANTVTMFFWDNKQLKKRFGRPQPGDANWDVRDTDYTKLRSSTGQYPQRVSMSTPDLGDYNLTILNFQGTNTGYQVDVELMVEESTRPFEVFDEDKAASFDEGEEGGRPSFDAPMEPGPGFGEPTPFVADIASGTAITTDPTLDRIASVADAGLDSIAETDLEAALAAPHEANAPPILARAEPPSTAVLLFWLALVPIGLIAGGVIWLVRRRAALVFGPEVIPAT